MTTRETQNKIINAALQLFNESGSRTISTNRIADECGISRGNLHYHFRTKEEIIQAVFQRIDDEMTESWYDDHLHPTIEHMHFMFDRQMKLIWKYRFFYREQAALLQNDARLKVLVSDTRRKREKEVRRFFEELVKAGYIDLSEKSKSMESLLLTSWLISDQWLPHIEMNDLQLDEDHIQEGFDLIFHLFLPYFTEKAMQDHLRLTVTNRRSGERLKIVSP